MSKTDKILQELAASPVTATAEEARINELAAKLRADDKFDYKPFPTNVFPPNLRILIEKVAKEFRFNVDFLCGSLLATVAGVVGRKIRVSSMIGLQSPNIYLVIVAPPGTGKSHPLRFTLDPIINKDRKRQQDLEDDLSLDTEGPVRRKKMLYNDYTIETLYAGVKGRPDGVMVYVDEISAWLDSFTRYNSSGEEAFWLSNFNGGYFAVDRKKSSLSLDNPAISVCGTIQDDVLERFVKGDRSKNGFLERILFIMPTNVKAPQFSDQIDFEYRALLQEEYSAFILSIYDRTPAQNEGRNYEPQVYRFEKSAFKQLISLCNEYQKLTEKTNNNTLKNLYAKMQTNLVKLALLVEIMYDAYRETPTNEVSSNSVIAAGLLVEYFIKTTQQIQHATLFNTAADKLTEPYKTIYKELGNIEGEFTTAEAIEMAIKNGLSRQSIERFLRNRDVVKKIRHGCYQKV